MSRRTDELADLLAVLRIAEARTVTASVYAVEGHVDVHVTGAALEAVRGALAKVEAMIQTEEASHA